LLTFATAKVLLFFETTKFLSNKIQNCSFFYTLHYVKDQIIYHLVIYHLVMHWASVFTP